LLGCVSAAAQAQNSIRLTNGEWQPYLSKDVPHHGIASHIISESFALVGVEVEYGFFPWSRAMKLAKEGTWDGSAVWSESEERLANFFFSDPVIDSSWVFFHLKDQAFDWVGYEDLANLKVGGTVEYYYSDDFEAAEAAGAFSTIRGRSDEVGLENLLRGRIDVFPGELMVTYTQIRDTFAPDQASLFVHHPKRIVDKPLALLFSRKVEGSEDMRDRFNEGLALLRESGRYDQIFADAMAGKYVKAH
jgi:polar amino acid transport system substrate-binding protein